MGKGSRRPPKFRRKDRKGRLKRKYGKDWNRDHFSEARHLPKYMYIDRKPRVDSGEPEKKYGHDQAELETGGDVESIFKKRGEMGLGIGLDILSEEYITPENTKKKRGRVPENPKEEDIPSYLWGHCSKMGEEEKDILYCGNECPISNFCETHEAGNLKINRTYAGEAFENLWNYLQS